MIMKKMNISLTAVLLFLSLVLVNSCSEETINLEPVGAVESGFFQSDADMDMAVKGIYQKVCFFYTYPGNQNNYVQQIFWLPSDDMMAKSPSDFAPDNFDALSSGNTPLSLFFNFAYQLIARVDVVLEKIEANGEAIYTKNPTLKDKHRGEALFLRSYTYFLLWNVFGTAPLVNERITDIKDMYPQSSKGTELLDQAITDLATAVTLLPTSWDAGNKGRVTKNSAYGLRAKCLVFRGNVAKNNADFTAAIADMNAITGVSLASNYGFNFDAGNENNQESLFEYQATQPTGNVNPFVGASGGNDAFAVIGEIGAWWGPLANKWNWIGNANVYATSLLQNAYEQSGSVWDPRRAFVCNSLANTNNILKYVQSTATYNTTPWVTPASNGLNGGCSVNNPRILRYADILLLKAEALVRSGGSLTEAIGLINQIRDRARKSTYIASVAPAPLPAAAVVPADRSTAETDRAVVLNWIFDERRLELACEEGHRWFDLRRRHIAGEIDLKTWNFGHNKVGGGFQDKHIYFPLPAGEVTNNPNMKQNQGY
jgi:starch-binding outer membrane protein, SusD/RagB family